MSYEISNPQYKWRVYPIGKKPGCWIVYVVDDISWFHRTMMTICFGFIWERA